MPIKMRHQIQNENGFSIIQVMVALGLLSIVMLANMSLTTMMSKSKVSQQVHFERDSLGNYIKSLLYHSDSCTAGIDKTLVIDSLNLAPEMKVAFSWPELELKDETELPKYKIGIQKVFVRSLRKVGVSDLTKETFFLGELFIKDKALSEILGGSEFKERSLGPLNFATAVNGQISKCSQAVLDIPKLSNLKDPGKNVGELLAEAGVALPQGDYPPDNVTAGCNLTCVVDNFYARNNLSNESKAAFFDVPAWKQIAQDYSNIASAVARLNGQDASRAPANGSPGLDYEILNNPYVTANTLNGLSHAVNDVGEASVQAFLGEQGAANTSVAANIISANGGYTSGSYSSADLNNLYNTAISAGLSASQVENYFANGGTIEGAMGAANSYNDAARSSGGY